MRITLLTNLGILAFGLGAPGIFIWQSNMRIAAFILACTGFVFVVVSLFIVRHNYATLIREIMQRRLVVGSQGHSLFDTMEGVVRIKCSESGETYEVKVTQPNTLLIQCPGCGAELPEVTEKQKWVKIINTNC